MAQFEKAIREEINEKYSKAQDSVSDSKRPETTMAIYTLRGKTHTANVTTVAMAIFRTVRSLFARCCWELLADCPPRGGLLAWKLP